MLLIMSRAEQLMNNSMQSMAASGLHHQPASSSLGRTFFAFSHLPVILYASLVSCVWHQVNNYRVLCSWLHTPNAGAGPVQGMAATAPVRTVISYLLFSSLLSLLFSFLISILPYNILLSLLLYAGIFECRSG
jgi:hypothetical protein